MTYNKLFSRLVNTIMSERQAKVYLALLQKGGATAAELQRDSGISQSKVYETVRYLVSRGFCREQKVGRRLFYEATNPEDAFTPDVHRLKSQIEEIGSLAGDLQQVFSTAERHSNPVEYIEVLHGNECIHRQYCDLVHGVKKELVGFGRPPYACDTGQKVKEQHREYGQFIKRKGVSRWVFQLDSAEDEWGVKAVRPMIELGIDVNISTSLPLKMMVFDRKTVLFAEESSLMRPGELTMVSIRNHAIASAFSAMFEFFWNTSTPFETWLADARRELREKAEPVTPLSLAAIESGRL